MLGLTESPEAVADSTLALPVNVDIGGGRTAQVGQPLFPAPPPALMSRDDVITADLSRPINFGAPGRLIVQPPAGVTFEPLVVDQCRSGADAGRDGGERSGAARRCLRPMQPSGVAAGSGRTAVGPAARRLSQRPPAAGGRRRSGAGGAAAAGDGAAAALRGGLAARCADHSGRGLRTCSTTASSCTRSRASRWRTMRPSC